MLKLSEGITVRIVRLLEHLAMGAIRSGAERMTQESFEALPARALLLSMEHRTSV
jgi:hypothetical protein